MPTYEFPVRSPWIYNNVWIQFTALEMVHQKQLYTQTGSIETVVTDNIFRFLLPNSWQENIGHDWEPNETIMGRFAQMFASGIKGVYQVGELAKGAVKGQLPNAPKETKVDTPLMYKNSMRREYTFTFDLAIQAGNYGINETVRKLEELSSPIYNDGITIEWPYIFSISTDPNGLLNVRYAALTAIQPTYYGPYFRRHSSEPTKCELTLTFREMEPLFDKNFGQTTTIITNPNQRR